MFDVRVLIAASVMSRSKYHVALEALLAQQLSLQRAQSYKVAAAECECEQQRSKLVEMSWSEVESGKRFLGNVLAGLENGHSNAMQTVKFQDESLDETLIRICSMHSLLPAPPEPFSDDDNVYDKLPAEVQAMVSQNWTTLMIKHAHTYKPTLPIHRQLRTHATDSSHSDEPAQSSGRPY